MIAIAYANDELGFFVGLTYALIALAVGVRVGYLGGRTGLSYAHSLARASGRGGLLIILISIIYATVIALYDLREAPNHSEYIKWTDTNGLWGLSLDNTAWDNNGRCHCCTCLPYAYAYGDINPTDVVYGALCRGFSIAYIAPVYSIIGAVCTGFVASIAFPFGARRRACMNLQVDLQ